jgi:hypothetical protein
MRATYSSILKFSTFSLLEEIVASFVTRMSHAPVHGVWNLNLQK